MLKDLVVKLNDGGTFMMDKKKKRVSMEIRQWERLRDGALSQQKAGIL